MLEILGWAALAIIVAGGLCALAVTVLPAGEQIAPALRDEPVWALPPERSLAATDVDEVRLPVALRGYRFAETDQLLDRLAEELRSRDLEIARLRGETHSGNETYAGHEASSGNETTGPPDADVPDQPHAAEPTLDDALAEQADAEHGAFRPGE